MTLWIAFGGSTLDNLFAFGMLALSGTWMLAIATVTGAFSATVRDQPLRVLVFAGFLILIPVVQLVPLPPTLWRDLPGRTLAAQAVANAGLETAWRPLTLSVPNTLETALECIWLLALAVGIGRLSADRIRHLCAILFGLTMLNILIGFVQIVSRGTLLDFYGFSLGDTLLGFYANKNHSALMIATGFLTGYAAFRPRASARTSQRAYFRFSIIAPVVLVMLVALVATNSRAGLLFGLAALAFAALSFWDRRVDARLRWLALGALALLAVGVLFSSSDLATRSLGRFAIVESDIRWEAWRRSLALVRLYFPVGAGIGSFVPLYEAIEQVSWLSPEYLNHVHNDYVEQLIEIGLAAPILWATFAIATIPATVAAWRTRARTEGVLALSGAMIVLLFVIHSGFDYPLRRPGTAVVFVIGLAMLLRFDAPAKLARQADLCEASEECSA